MKPEVGVQRPAAARSTPGPKAAVDLRDQAESRSEGVGAGRLDELVKALLRAVSLADVAAAVVSYGTAAVGARWARAVLLEPDGSVAVSLLGGQAVRSRRFESDGSEVGCPWVDAIRDGGTLVFPSAEEVRRLYPAMTGDVLPSEGAVITAPMGTTGRHCGAVTFGFDDRGPISEVIRTAVANVAALAAAAAPRAAIYETDYRAAEMLQQAYLPGRLPDVAGLTFASRCLSASGGWGIAGDWYDALALPGPHVGLVMGDVAGHGIQAATVMASLRGAVRAFCTVEDSPAAILTRMNNYLAVFKPDAFATLFVAIFDPATGRLVHARAGHPPALILRPNGGTELLDEPVGPPLGLPGTRYREGEQEFPPGSTLVVYTDGLIERQDRDIDQSMADLVRTVSGQQRRSPEDLCDRLVELLAGAELFDDATLLVAARDGAGACSPAP